MQYMFPVTSMPKDGSDWPTVASMIASNQRFVVFTSAKTKEASEGIAYQWNYVVENECKCNEYSSLNFKIFKCCICSLQIHNKVEYLDCADGTVTETCVNREESAVLTDTTKSLILENYFPSTPNSTEACVINSGNLANAITVCHAAAGNRWSNFLAVDFYKVSLSLLSQTLPLVWFCMLDWLFLVQDWLQYMVTYQSILRMRVMIR